MEKQIEAVWLNESGFPYSISAPAQKQKLLCRALTAANVHVTVINHRAVHNPQKGESLKAEGRWEGIDYIYTAGTPFRPPGFIRRNLLKLFGIFNEIKLLFRLHRRKKIDVAILHTRMIVTVFLYRMGLKLLSIPVIMPATEYDPGKSDRKGILRYFNDFLFRRFGYRLVDGAMPISEFLMDQIRKHAPNTRIVKVPVLSDFSRYQGMRRNGTGSYFLFCGHLDYFEVVEFILRSFELVDCLEKVSLYLVVAGRAAQMSRLQETIGMYSKNKCVRVFSGVSDEELSSLYFNAKGLLIPLRQTLQDCARFPHKIGEYLASGNPVITTNVGEIRHYFVDAHNALVAENYDVEEFAGKMDYVLRFPDHARKIGENGRDVGLRNFNYKAYGPKLKRFILRTIAGY